MGDELLGSHNILVINMKFLNKLFNLLIFLSFPEMESRIRIILKYVIDIAKVLGIKGSVTIKVLSIYQYYSTEFFNILHQMILEFDKIQMVQSILQRSTIIGKNYSYGGNVYLRSSFYQQHQFWYLLKKSIYQSAPWLLS